MQIISGMNIKRGQDLKNTYISTNLKKFTYLFVGKDHFVWRSTRNRSQDLHKKRLHPELPIGVKDRLTSRCYSLRLLLRLRWSKGGQQAWMSNVHLKQDQIPMYYEIQILDEIELCGFNELCGFKKPFAALGSSVDEFENSNAIWGRSFNQQ